MAKTEQARERGYRRVSKVESRSVICDRCTWRRYIVRVYLLWHTCGDIRAIIGSAKGVRFPEAS